MAQNTPVTLEDIQLAEKIFGKDVATLKGKSVKPHPPVVMKEDVIELPPELIHIGRKVDLAIDVVFIHDECFLNSIDRTIKFPALVPLETRAKGKDYDAKVLFGGLDRIPQHYNRADIYILIQFTPMVNFVHCLKK